MSKKFNFLQNFRMKSKQTNQDDLTVFSLPPDPILIFHVPENGSLGKSGFRRSEYFRKIWWVNKKRMYVSSVAQVLHQVLHNVVKSVYQTQRVEVYGTSTTFTVLIVTIRDWHIESLQRKIIRALFTFVCNDNAHFNV